MDHYFYFIFLCLVLDSVTDSMHKFINNDTEETNDKTHNIITLCVVSLWVFCHLIRDVRNIIEIMSGQKAPLSSFRLWYDIFVHILFLVAISFKVRNST